MYKVKTCTVLFYALNAVLLKAFIITCTMDFRKPSSSCYKHWDRSFRSCCRKELLLLLVWQVFFSFSSNLLLSCAAILHFTSPWVITGSEFFSGVFAPLIGWLADVKIGRYKTIKFGSIVSFSGSIFFYFALFTGGISTLSEWLFSLAIVLVTFGNAAFTVAIIPFFTDQMIGASTDELSSLICWYVWANNFGFGLSFTITYMAVVPYINVIGVGVAGIFAICLAAIIVSDCMCQQWLDKTHKVTNPIKLIIQVLNYTRKHKYPERRSAFTYIDEEQPARIDFGKDKFGGPFIEEEVEDVKLVMRLLPLLICLSIATGIANMSPISLVIDLEYRDIVLNIGMKSWLFPILLIPIHQFLINPCFQKYFPNMLNCITAGLLLHLVGYTMLVMPGIWGVIVSNDTHRYLSCIEVPPRAAMWPDYYIPWYWKLAPFLVYGTGRTVLYVVFLNFLIAQIPEKMKGLGIGLMFAISSLTTLIVSEWERHCMFTVCYDVSTVVLFALLFVIVDVLSKRYKLRERNRVINLHFIAEEHYERYLDQEEEFLRENPQYRDTISSESSSEDTSCSSD